MKITVAICTWNRAALLGQTLSEMRKLVIPPGIEWELLVVNNASTDDTAGTIDRHRDGLPLVDFYEKVPGLSNARNRAVESARGDWILWTDDDVLVDPGWLSAYVDAIRQWPDCAFFGGEISPWLEPETPGWLLEAWNDVAAAYATRKLGQTSFVFDADSNRLPFGANYVVKTEVQRRYRYNPALGLNHGVSLLGEETALFQTLMKDGFTGRWVPAAGVRHFIPRDRQTIHYLRRYYTAYGRTCEKMDPSSTGNLASPRAAKIALLCLEAELRYRVARLFCAPSQWVRYLQKSSMMQGRLQSLK
jgi:glycosyltransferase involved in cell wall biosynthesis